MSEALQAAVGHKTEFSFAGIGVMDFYDCLHLPLMSDSEMFLPRRLLFPDVGRFHQSTSPCARRRHHHQRPRVKFAVRNQHTTRLREASLCKEQQLGKRDLRMRASPSRLLTRSSSTWAALTFSRPLPRALITPQCRASSTSSKSSSRTLTQQRAPNVTYLSKFFNPISTQKQQASADVVPPEPGSADDALEMLLRGGYIAQSSSGVFTFLPNGLLLLRRVESIIEEEMASINASRLEMPTLLSNKLWKKSGRDAAMGSELYRLKDRKGSQWVLAPTHEEEVTKVVGSTVQSYKQLPVKVYQITRKHRDEPRPRLGLLRTREFIMKDLYTFDADIDRAIASYKDVQEAYKRIMDRLFGDKWRVAEADTGAMGGKLSHEYHVQDPSGEDDLVVCPNDACKYTANAELATSKPAPEEMPVVAEDVDVRLYAQSQDATFAGTLTVVVASATSTINDVKLRNTLAATQKTPTPHEQIFPLTSSNETHWDWKDRPDGPFVRFDSVQIIVDHACYSLSHEDIQSAIVSSLLAYSRPPNVPADAIDPTQAQTTTLSDFFTYDSLPLTYHDLRLVQSGHKCVHCSTPLESTKSIEVGHTFVLGERYSSALGYQFAAEPRFEMRIDKKTGQEKQVQVQERKNLQMGCYGLGVTRLIGVLAIQARKAYFEKVAFPSSSSSENTDRPGLGLLWPEHLAPFTKVILQASSVPDPNQDQIMQQLLDNRGPDDRYVVDDRPHVSLGQKSKEADLLGVPGALWQVGAGDKHKDPPPEMVQHIQDKQREQEERENAHKEWEEMQKQKQQKMEKKSDDRLAVQLKKWQKQLMEKMERRRIKQEKKRAVIEQKRVQKDKVQREKREREEEKRQQQEKNEE